MFTIIAASASAVLTVLVLMKLNAGRPCQESRSVLLRVPLEVAVFSSAWILAFLTVMFMRDLMIGYESLSSGTPIETIIARHDASSGMVAFGEALETIYLATLLYLLWPIVFNLAGRRFRRRTSPIH